MLLKSWEKCCNLPFIRFALYLLKCEVDSKICYLMNVLSDCRKHCHSKFDIFLKNDNMDVTLIDWEL